MKIYFIYLKNLYQFTHIANQKFTAKYELLHIYIAT